MVCCEYCFNKSHSTAYGGLRTKTAYLKRHFPVALHGGVLTRVNAGSTDRCSVMIAKL